MIAHPSHVRYFSLGQLVEAMSFAEQGGIAVHLERRRYIGPRGVSYLGGQVYRVVGLREQLRAWGQRHAQWEAHMLEQEGEPGLCFYIVTGATSQRLAAELRLDQLPVV